MALGTSSGAIPCSSRATASTRGIASESSGLPVATRAAGEPAWRPAAGIEEACGPFDAATVQACLAAGAAAACYTNRWAYALYRTLR